MKGDEVKEMVGWGGVEREWGSVSGQRSGTNDMSEKWNMERKRRKIDNNKRLPVNYLCERESVISFL